VTVTHNNVGRQFIPRRRRHGTTLLAPDEHQQVVPAMLRCPVTGRRGAVEEVDIDERPGRGQHHQSGPGDEQPGAASAGV